MPTCEQCGHNRVSDSDGLCDSCWLDREESTALHRREPKVRPTRIASGPYRVVGIRHSLGAHTRITVSGDTLVIRSPWAPGGSGVFNLSIGNQD